MSYLKHFGFNIEPFAADPPKECIFQSIRNKDSIALLRDAIENNKGSGMLTGTPGTGKTTIANLLVESLSARFQIISIPQLIVDDRPKATLSTAAAVLERPIVKGDAVELMTLIGQALRVKLPDETPTHRAFADLLAPAIKAIRDGGREVLLFIDSAEQLEGSCFELLDMLTKPAYEDGDGLRLRILLVGLPQAHMALEKEEHALLLARIKAHFQALALTRDEIDHYINFRTKAAGVVINLFEIPAISVIHQLAGGLPGLINEACDRCLEKCAADNKAKAGRELTLIATGQMEDPNSVARRQAMRRYGKLGGIGAVSVLVLGGLIYFIAPHLKFGGKSSERSTKTEEPKSDKKGAAGSADPSANKQEKAAHGALDAPGESADVDTPGKQRKATGSASMETEAEKKARAEAAALHTLAYTPRDEPYPLRPDGEYDTPITKELDNEITQDWERHFTLWSALYQHTKANDAPCDYARTKGVYCLQGQGTMMDLERFNRPVMLLIQNNADTQQHLGVVERISPSSVRITVGQVTYHVPKDQLEAKWNHEFLLFWKPPDPLIGIDFLEEGMQGRSVLWLRERLEYLFGYPPVGNPQAPLRRIYDKPLQQMVEAYQASRRLPKSAGAALRTLISISIETPEPGTPQVVTEEEDPAPLTDWLEH